MQENLEFITKSKAQEYAQNYLGNITDSVTSVAYQKQSGMMLDMHEVIDGKNQEK